MNQADLVWRKCSTCKKDILLNSKYYECNVSTCTGQRTGYVFCGISCWEVHLPGAKHRNAGAVEKKSPQSNQLSGVVATSQAPKRIIVSSTQLGSSSAVSSTQGFRKSSMSQEVLIVVSKMKQYIRDISEMNTAEEVATKLSDLVRLQCDEAIENARADGRKTVMARDFKF